MKTRSLLRGALAAYTCMGLASAGWAQTYAISTNPAGVAYIPGVDDSGNHCDDCAVTNTLPLPFPFPVSFFGTSYGSGYPDSNGFLDFTTAHPVASGFYNNTCSATGAGVGPAILLHWNDMRTDATGNGIFTTTVGDAPNRTFVIEWRASFYDGTPGTALFEVLFYEGQTYFDVVYGATVPSSGAGATAGVQSDGTATGLGYVQYSCNTASLTPGLVIRYNYIPPSPGACCASDGSCTVVLPPDCAAPSLFQAASSTCAPAGGCPAVVSACCDNNTGACTFVNGTTCATGTTNQGAGSVCGPTTCPTGACCDSATLSCSILTAAGCSNGYQGDNTTCTSAPCSFGACCNGCAGCNISTSTSCSSASGTYFGDGSTCEASGCTIINGGFESGNFAPGWTHYGTDALVAVYTGTGPGTGGLMPHSGNWALDAGPTEPTPANGVRQNIPAHVGDQVTISFWYAAAGGGPNEFILMFDGVVLTDMLNDLSNPNWTQLTFTATSTSEGPLLDMNFYNGPAWTFIDDVTVCIQSASAGVCCRGATCSTTVAQAACTGSGTAGAVFASASSCNSGAVSNSPCCYADYNKANGITVQDIFDFLSDWFAGNNFAKVGGDGSSGPLAVQNIFDFLSNWFAGGCS